MGLTTISNGKVTAVFSDKGAEPQSLIYNNTEYIWQADPAFWNRHAPVLFPFVGRCCNDKYSYAGVEYKMGQHGFARDNEFELISKGASSVIYLLRSTPELKARYPFDFEFYIEYRLEGTSLSVKYTVKNTGSSMMFFSVGSHEAYRCPLVEGERFEDYRISFNSNERIDRFFLEDGLVSRTCVPFVDFGQALPLRHDYFEKGAAVLKNVRSNRITLKSKVSGRGVEVTTDGFKNVGIWQPKNAPFICIEPWLGISDEAGFCGELPLKTDIVRVNTGASHVCRHTITLF